MEQFFKLSYQFTALPRSLDLRYPSHRTAAVLALIGMVVGLLTQLPDDPQVGDYGLALALGVALGGGTWALARELDPDYPRSAALAGFIALGVVLLQDAQLQAVLMLGLIGLILPLRIVNRTTGIQAKPLDALAAAALAGLLAASDLWVLGFLPAIAFLLDASLPEPHPRGRIYAALTAVVAVGVGLLSHDLKLEFDNHELIWLVILTAFGVSRFVVPKYPEVFRSTCDATRAPLHRQRIVAATALGALSMIAVSWLGYDETLAVLPLWASLVALIAWYTVLKNWLAEEEKP